MNRFFLFLIKIYQLFISPDYGLWPQIGQGCRFYPSCSVFTYQAIEKYGVLKGIIKSLKRIIKCHPFSSGGYDPLI